MASNVGQVQTGNKRRAQQTRSKLHQFINDYVSLAFFKYLLLNPESLSIVTVLVVIAELVINIFIIHKVHYTEIDWIAYMQECEGFLNGTLNYALLKGDTGPLVYPAGFVYIYSTLYYITSKGQNIRVAQYIFAIIYVLQIFLVLRLYMKSCKVPPYVLLLNVFTSYRIHSIYALRLFNDPIAILLTYIAINLYLDEKWTLGSVFFSLGVAVKMNVLLFAPAILILYITNLGYRRGLQQLMVCAAVQLILGAPFLLSYPVAYLKGSFNFGRIFEHKWTVNYRFLDSEIFEKKTFHLVLLCIHISLLAVFTPSIFTYFKNYCRLRELQRQFEPQIKRQNAKIKQSKKKNVSNHEDLTPEQQLFLDSFEKSLKKSTGKANPTTTKEQQETTLAKPYGIKFDKSIQLVLLPLFLCNFIGICCARSLHYQFYVWYFHSLPYLTWCTEYNLGIRFLILGIIELCWNTYPSTNLSSVMLHACHLILLIGIGRYIFKSHSLINKMK